MIVAQDLESLLDEFSGLGDACGSDPSALCRWVYQSTDNVALSRAVSVLMPILTILAIAWIASRLIRRVIRRSFDRAQREAEARADQAEAALLAAPPGDRAEAAKRFEADQAAAVRAAQRAKTLSGVLASAVTIIVAVVAVVMALGELGYSLGPLIAGAGIVGAALGFGAQSLVKDFLSGMFILVEDQYGVGDVVDLGEASGVVEEVQLRITKVRGIDGTLWYVPNGEIARVANRTQLWARTVLDIGVAYDTDIEQASSIIKQVADGIWQAQEPNHLVLEEPQVWGVEELGDSAIVIRMVCRTDAGDQWNVARALRARIKVAFDEAGIEIPFPQRVMWTKNLDEPART